MRRPSGTLKSRAAPEPFAGCAPAFSLRGRRRGRPCALDGPGSQPDHAFPAPDGSSGSRQDSRGAAIEFSGALADPAGRARTRRRHGSGPRGPGFKSRAPDQFLISNPLRLFDMS